MTDYDRVKKPLVDFIRAETAGADFHALYPCRVVAQNADGTLELQPDAATVPQQSAVPLRLGVPGVEVSVAPGARVLLGFENGEPHRPVATLWEASGLLELRLGVGAVDQVAVARLVEAQLGALVVNLQAAFGAGAASFLDGGTSLAAAMQLKFAGFPGGTGSSLVKVKP